MMIENKPIPVLSSHYELDTFLKKYDSSFFSRFGPKVRLISCPHLLNIIEVDMDDLVYRRPKPEWPERSRSESEQEFKQRLVRKQG